ncbi:hypothetical protein A7U60_g2411 [Sanghuangporus baumii]|uniref:PH domain-containing protein n=1 Tax=Sanghuangporus baumii TaxID=108892 RepID=A0A9Q5I2B1_SANBA|nr:hypothetical protein A7U60_g2411 [Sanghuangporus baumii]
MSLTTDSERSDHEPSPAGLRSPLYGTATFGSLSPSSAPAPLSDSGASSTRLSYPSRSVTPSTADDGPRLRRVAISPTVSSYDSRRYTDSELYSDDNSINDAAEVEDALSHIDDDDSQVSRGDNWSSAYLSSAVSATSRNATGSYATATTEPLNFEHERRSLSTISEQTEVHSLNSGVGMGTSILQSLFSRPTSLFSAAARSLYGAPTSPLTPPSTVGTGIRPATPERHFKPPPPTGRRVGNLVASFESDIAQSRPGSVPLGPRSPSPFSNSSRPTSPTKSTHSRSYTDSAYTHSRSNTEGSISLAGHSQSASYSSYLSPPPPTSALSHSTLSGSSETERPRSPLSSVRNTVAAWKERSPEKTSASTSRSVASQSVVSGPSYSSSSMSSLGLGLGGGFFSLRRRAALSATSGGSRSRGAAPSYTDDFGSTNGSGTDIRSLGRSGSVRSVGGSSILDMSELGSFIRGNQDPLRVGYLWYLNVHAPPPFRWQRCRAILYPNTLLLTWLAPGGGRGVVTLDLVNCNEVRSVPSPSHVSARDDIGTIAARLQMDEGGSGVDNYDLIEMLCPFQLLYSDGAERLAAESARERVQWVGAIWDALDRATAPPDRSMTVSPTGSIRTIRSATSSIVSSGSGSGSATTTYLPPLDTIPDLSDLDTTFTRALSRGNSFTSNSLSSFAMARSRSSDDGAISGRGGLLHPLVARSIEIAPSRSSSLRRTSSLADLDAEFASVLRGSGITFDSDTGTRTRSRGGSSRFSARWTHVPSEHGASSTISPSESASATGVTRRVRASTFYSQSEPTFTQLSSQSSTSSEGTQIIPSSLSLRGTSSASLLGDSHDGPPTSEDSQRVRSPTTPTRARSPDTLYSSTSGLLRASAVRRRTPRSTRTYSRSVSTRGGPTTTSTSDKENEVDEPSQWSSLQGSYTSTSIEYSEYLRTLASSDSGEPLSELSPKQKRVKQATPKKPVSESDDDVFVTPTASRSASSYHSLPGTPTPSSSSIPTSEFDTAMKAPSTEFVTADICPSEPPSTEYTTAPVCPSTPPATEYFTAECRCQRQPPSLPEQISSLTPSLSLTSVSEEKPIETEVASLYAPTIPSLIEEANIPLPESEEELVSPPSESTQLSPSPLPSPKIISATPSSVSETSVVTTTSLTPSTEPSIPAPSSPSSPSIPSPSSPSSPSSVEYKSESSRTPKSRSLYVPSQSPKSVSWTLSDYESSLFMPSPSLQSVPIQEPQGDISFETSFMRPGVSEMLSEQSPSPFLPKGMEVSGLSSTVSPSSTTVATTSSISETPTATRTWDASTPTPSSVSTTSSLSSTQVSGLTPSSAFLEVPPARGPRRTPTPSSLTLISYVEGSEIHSSEPYTEASSLTPSSPFEDEGVLGRTVTVSRTPSSVSSISTASMRSSIFAPTEYGVESPHTVPTLLSSRSATPRPMTPRDVPLPSSPSLSIVTATPSASISTPRSDAQTLTSVVTSDILEVPREEILTHDVNRLLRYLHDLDQIRGGETQDIKDHLGRIEDELRDLADFLRKPAATLKDTSVGSSVPIPRTPQAVPREHVSPAQLPTAIVQEPSATSASTVPLPVPEPRGMRTPEARTPIPSLTPPQQLAMSLSYSPSTVSRDLSILESPRSDDLLSLRDYPAVPISPPGSPSSPSSFGSGWPSSSTDAPFPPSSVTPSTVTRSSVVPGFEEVSDLTAESPFLRATTPFPVPSPLASLASAESALPLPPQSSTPSGEADVSPRAAGPYGGSPLPTPSPLEPSSVRSSLSMATAPPSSSMPSSSPPSTAREGPTIEIRQPASPVVSISEVEGIPSPAPPASAALSRSQMDELPEPTPVFPVPPPGMPVPEILDLQTVPPSPSISVPTARPSPQPSRALDELRDLLEDLRGQAQALWNGQLAANRLLENLAQREVPAAPAPEAEREELGNRLRNIEGLLDGILRDLARAIPEEPTSEISSETSSALRRYIDRLRDRRHEPIHMPTPVRAPPPALDSEWLEFLSEPPPVAEQPIQGPPPLVSLYRRAPRRRRESISPPVSIEWPIRSRSVPPSPPSLRLRDTRSPWTRPRVPRSDFYPESPYDDTGRPSPFDLRDQGHPRPPRRPLSTRVGGRRLHDRDEDIDMLDNIHRLRRQRRPGTDGRVDVTVPGAGERSPSFEVVPPPPHSAPPAMGHEIPDFDTVQVPGAPPPQPQPVPGGPVGAPPGILLPGMMPMGPPPQFDEMLNLLRQNRLAQTASIDQQREIMRYMRALNQWLERDVRDRHAEMRAIAGRVDDLRDLLRGQAPGGVPMPMPQAPPGQPTGAPGQTFIVPPMPAGMPPIMPQMPMPQMPITPIGSGPPVVPPFYPGTEPGFIPPRPGEMEPPVIPPRPGGYSPPSHMRPRPGDYADERSSRTPSPFIPPRPASMMPIPPPVMGPQQPVTIIPPPRPIDVQRSTTRSSSPRSSRSRTPSPSRMPSVHVHVPSPQPQPPPTVVRMGDQGLPSHMPSGPLHPDIAGTYSRPSTVAPQQPTQPPIVIAPPAPVPPPLGAPSAYPGEQPTQPIVIRTERSPSLRRDQPVVVVPPSPSRRESPTRVVVTAPSARSRRSYRDHSRSPPERLHRAPTRYSERDRPSRRRSPSEYSPRRRRRESEERDRPRRSRSRSRSRSPPPPPMVIRTESRPPMEPMPPTQIVVPPTQGPPPIIAQPPMERFPSRYSSRSRSRTPPPVIIQQPPGPVAGYPPPPTGPPVVVAPPSHAPSQPPVVVPPPPSHVVYEEPHSPLPTHIPSMVPSQPQPPTVIQVPTSRVRSRTRSPRRSISPRDPGRRLRGRSRSPYSPERYHDDRDRRRPRSPYSPERYRDDRERRRPRSPYSPGRSRDRRRYGPEDEDYDRRRRPSPAHIEADRPRSPRERILRSPPVTAGYVPSRPPSVGPAYERPISPTRVVVQPRPRTPPPPERVTLGPAPAAPTYAGPEAAYEPPSQVITVPGERLERVPTRLEPSPTMVRMPSGRRTPTRLEPSPTVVRMPSGRRTPTRLEEVPPPISVQPSYHPSAEGAYPIPPPSPGAAYRSAIHGARSDTEPVIPVVPAPPGRVPTHGIPPEPIYAHDEGVPSVVRTHPPRPGSIIYEPRPPSGPGDLAFQDALREREERLEDQEHRFEDLAQAAVDAEERREQYFREHEEERDRILRENLGQHQEEIAQLREDFEHIREDAEHIRDEFEHALQQLPRPAGAPPLAEQPPVSGEVAEVTEGAVPTVEAERESIESVRPVPPPVSAPGVAAEGLPQLQEILDLLRAQQTENVQCKAEQTERFDILRDEIEQARADTKAECEERIRLLEDELARAREELEREREQRRAEELERIEREHADVIERDEAVRGQLSDITNLVQEQHEELARKRELMDERWAEKERRREEKQGRFDAMYEMLERILQEREQERREREEERAAAAQRPSIEAVLDELKRQNDQQIQLINSLTDAWRADSARQHEDTLNAVRATAQEMVPYNLTGYLDEFSKALAGEIRTLLGEVGRLHEQKRTLQFEIGTLLHWQAQYGPGGQFEPDWQLFRHPTAGPLAPQPPPPGGGMPPGPPPPGPEEPPPPARPAWRTVQQRQPRRRRTRPEAGGPQQPPPGQTLAPQEPIPHPPSWSTWQPNPAFVPTPPPPGASTLLVPPPSGPTGLFGPRSPSGTMYPT